MNRKRFALAILAPAQPPLIVAVPSMAHKFQVMAAGVSWVFMTARRGRG